MRTFTLLLLTLAWLPVGAAAEKITVDPNAAKPGIEQEQTPQLDARLAKKVTCDARKKSVAVILADLSEKTGVKLYAGRNSKDWQVRDRRMNIFAEDVTLASLMNSIARVMKFKWEKNTEKKEISYRLYMDRKSLLDEEARRAREEDRQARAETERRQKALESYIQAFTASPEQLEKLRDENPFGYFVASTGITKPLGYVFLEMPAMMNAMAAGTSLDALGSSLSANGQQSLLNAIKIMRQIENKMDGRDRPFPDDLNMNNAVIRINPNAEQSRGWPQSNFMLGEMQIEIGKEFFDIPMIDPQSNVSKAMGRMLIDTVVDGKPAPNSEMEMPAEIGLAMMADVKARREGDQKVEHPDEPWLHEKVALKLSSSKLDETESAIAQASRLAVVSDSFSSHFGINLPSNQIEMRKLLELFSDGYGYDWERSGSVLELRDKKWYSKRALQIPDAWLDAWRDALVSNGTLTLQEMAQMANLSYEQIGENLVPDDVLQRVGQTIRMFRDRYRIFGMLSDAQTAMLSGENGLISGSLSPDQFACVQKIISQFKPLFMKKPDMDFTMRLTRTVRDDGIIRNVLAFTSDDPENQFKCVMDMPHYEAPKKTK